MKSTTFATLAVLAAAMAPAGAAELKLSPSEVQQGKLYLEQTRAEVIGATQGLSAAQWNFKPAPDRWSIAEVVEHIVMAQDLILGPVRDQLAKAPPAAGLNTQKIDTVIRDAMQDRTQKFQAPDVIKPTGHLAPAEAMERLRKNYDRLIDYLVSTPDLRQHAVEALPLKAISKGAYDTMDGYEWVLAAASHTERHTKQILEVRADPGFPAK